MEEKLIKIIAKNSQIAELFLYLFSAIGYILFISKSSLGVPILIMGISCLAIIFLFRGIAECNQTNDIYFKFIIKVINWSMCMTLVGVLFTLINLNENRTILIGGTGSLIIGLMFAIYFSTQIKISNLKYLIFRSLLIVTIGVLLILKQLL